MRRRTPLHPDYVRPEDLPYGPGNPDYEYDGWVAEQLDEERERAQREKAEQHKTK